MTRMHHPLRGATADEIINYPYPSVDESKLDEFRKKGRRPHKRGLASFAFMQMTVWEGFMVSQIDGRAYARHDDGE